jgi:hypothetical protein
MQIRTQKGGKGREGKGREGKHSTPRKEEKREYQDFAQLRCAWSTKKWREDGNLSVRAQGMDGPFVITIDT